MGCLHKNAPQMRVMNGPAMRDHLRLVKETRWIPVEREMPDADITVQIACPHEDEPVWIGHFDGAEWRTPTGKAVVVSHWKDMPEPPAWAKEARPPC